MSVFKRDFKFVLNAILSVFSLANILGVYHRRLGIFHYGI